MNEIAVVAGDQELAVGAECHGGHVVAVVQRWTDGLAGDRVPDAGIADRDLGRPARGGAAPAIGTEGRDPHGRPRVAERATLAAPRDGGLSGRPIPQAGGVVAAPGQHGREVRTVADDIPAQPRLTLTAAPGSLDEHFLAARGGRDVARASRNRCMKLGPRTCSLTTTSVAPSGLNARSAIAACSTGSVPIKVRPWRRPTTAAVRPRRRSRSCGRRERTAPPPRRADAAGAPRRACRSARPSVAPCDRSKR